MNGEYGTTYIVSTSNLETWNQILAMGQSCADDGKEFLSKNISPQTYIISRSAKAIGTHNWRTTATNCEVWKAAKYQAESNFT